MGYTTNHTIIVIRECGDALEKAHAKACEIFRWVSPISDEALNGSRAFFIPPDGSKEGWKDSELGDARREEFKAYLRTLKYEDGSSPVSWCEAICGGDDEHCEIMDSHRH